MRELLLLALELVERTQQLLVLLLNLLDQSLGPELTHRFDDVVDALGGRDRHPARKVLFKPDLCARGSGLYRKAIHQPPRANDAEPHSRRRSITPRHDVVQPRDPGALVFDANHEFLRTRLDVDVEMHGSVPRIAEGIADDFRDRGRQASLL